jgi:hypothetical protein
MLYLISMSKKDICFVEQAWLHGAEEWKLKQLSVLGLKADDHKSFGYSVRRKEGRQSCQCLASRRTIIIGLAIR